MIVVVEGPSAAGKTTWANAHGSDLVIAESGRAEPPAELSDTGLARFWTDLNCRRWADAVQMELAGGLAVCDTDPLKLHYDYCLARIGMVSWERFAIGVDAVAAAIGSRLLGIADLMLVNIPDDKTLERQRDADPKRGRRNFDLHRRLGPGLLDWYATLDHLDPGRVGWEYPREMPEPVVRDRYDDDLFREWMARLPRPDSGA